MAFPAIVTELPRTVEEEVTGQPTTRTTSIPLGVSLTPIQVPVPQQGTSKASDQGEWGGSRPNRS
jgi:hypothetical protein